MFADNFYSQLHYADGSLSGPRLFADIKSSPTDFIVNEWMNVECSGEGEHIWLNITKTKMHTDQVLKALVKLAGVHPKDVGVSGMKDFLAETSQWFSVRLPGVVDEELPDWKSLEGENFKINQICRHNRKLKRGTHLGNEFKIVLRNLDGDIESFIQRVELIQQQGVPNYFGEQRFGRGGSNLKQAHEAMLSGRRIKQRQKRSMVLSSSRSWIFNCVLSARLAEGTWLTVQDGEPLNLEGSRQFFVSEDIAESQERVNSHDVHTTAPLWGKGQEKVLNQTTDIFVLENSIIDEYALFKKGLIDAGLDYSRRAMRYFAHDLSWTQQGENIELAFTLGRGQFATSLLRELVSAR